MSGGNPELGGLKNVRRSGCLERVEV
jgi:hypothetical protein